MLAVIDTNILVSGFGSRDGNPAKVLGLVVNGRVRPCTARLIMREQRTGWVRSKFGFSQSEIYTLLGWFDDYGLSVVPEPMDCPFADEADKKFYEVAKHCGAVLVTGNLKHFPQDPQIVSAAAFLEMIQP